MNGKSLNSIKFPYSDGLFGSLIPLQGEVIADEELIKILSIWRNSNLKYFFDQKLSTLDSTKSYLDEVLVDDNHQMYFIFDSDDHLTGHIGYKLVSNSEAELDNLVRGENRVPADFVESAEKALIQSIFSHPEMSKINLRVLSSNVLAKRIHFNLGFEVLKVSPYYRTESLRLVELEEGYDEKVAVGYITYMTLSRDRFDMPTS